MAAVVVEFGQSHTEKRSLSLTRADKGAHPAELSGEDLLSNCLQFAAIECDWQKCPMKWAFLIASRRTSWQPSVCVRT